MAAASIKSREATEAPQTGWSLTRKCFKNAFRNVTCERPPRPRLFGTGPFFDAAATPPLQGGEYAHLNSFTATVTTATQTGLVLIFLLQAILGVALLTESNILSFFAMLQSQQLVIPSRISRCSSYRIIVIRRLLASILQAQPC